MRYRLKQWVIYLGLSGLMLIVIQPHHWAQSDAGMLQGHIEHYGATQAPGLRKIYDQQTQQPLANVEVTIPDTGFKTRTDEQGQFAVPSQYLNGKSPLILSIQKQGYLPFSATISQANKLPFELYLQKQLQAIILDSQIRHLGDGSYSQQSNNAFNFRKQADGPGIKINFKLNQTRLSEQPYLQIGSIVGLDTKMAHMLSGNPISATASALTVKINGKVIAQVQVNGDQQRVMIPRNLLNPNGNNELDIQTGHQLTDELYIDYDDMELMNLVLYL